MTAPVAMAALMAISSAASAVSTYSAGKATQAYYAGQGQMAELQGRQQALAYRQQGLEALDRQIKLEAQINARGFAGGLDPFSGSTAAIAENNLAEAYEEFDMSRQNAAIAEGMGGFQAEIYNAAGKSAGRRGTLDALAKLAEGGFKVWQVVK